MKIGKIGFAPTNTTRLSRFIWQTLFFNLSATAVVTALNYVRFGWQEAFSTRNFISILIYSNCIGTLCGIMVTLGVPSFPPIRFS